MTTEYTVKVGPNAEQEPCVQPNFKAVKDYVSAVLNNRPSAIITIKLRRYEDPRATRIRELAKELYSLLTSMSRTDWENWELPDWKTKSKEWSFDNEKIDYVLYETVEAIVDQPSALPKRPAPDPEPDGLSAIFG